MVLGLKSKGIMKIFFLINGLKQGKSQCDYMNMSDIESIIDRTLLDGFILDGNSIPGEITVHLRKKLK